MNDYVTMEEFKKLRLAVLDLADMVLGMYQVIGSLSKITAELSGRTTGLIQWGPVLNKPFPAPPSFELTEEQKQVFAEAIQSVGKEGEVNGCQQTADADRVSEPRTNPAGE